MQNATLDPFHGYKNAIDDQLDARAVLDAFHVVKLATRSRRGPSPGAARALEGAAHRPFAGLPQQG